MSVKKDKPYKMYRNKESGTLYITKGDNFLYYKATPYEKYKWTPLRKNPQYKVKQYINFMNLIREMSEGEVFLELL